MVVLLTGVVVSSSSVLVVKARVRVVDGRTRVEESSSKVEESDHDRKPTPARSQSPKHWLATSSGVAGYPPSDSQRSSRSPLSDPQVERGEEKSSPRGRRAARASRARAQVFKPFFSQVRALVKPLEARADARRSISAPGSWASMNPSGRTLMVATPARKIAQTYKLKPRVCSHKEGQRKWI